jgi:hypothetical protein
MAAIRCSDEQIQSATESFPCQVVEFPLKYLGMPLAPGKLPKLVWQPLSNRVADRLPVWKGNLMNHSGRLALIKSTLCTIPLYTVIGLGLPPWVQKALVKIMKAFLWRGTDTVQAGKCLVAWPYVQSPLEMGGLGVLDLSTFDMALHLRWMWLSQTDPTRPWLVLAVQVDPCMAAFFHSSVQVVVGDGKATLFWHDKWIDGRCIADFAPDSVDAVPRSKHNSVFVSTALPAHAWMQDVLGVLTIHS